jgi:hypothetical protein
MTLPASVRAVRNDAAGRGQDALDLRVTHNVAVVEHAQTVHGGLVRRALEGVLDIVGGHHATVLVLAGLELGVVANREGVGETVVADGPLRGKTRA